MFVLMNKFTNDRILFITESLFFSIMTRIHGAPWRRGSKNYNSTIRQRNVALSERINWGVSSTS